MIRPKDDSSHIFPSDDELPSWAGNDDLWRGYEKWLDERNDDDRDYWGQ